MHFNISYWKFHTATRLTERDKTLVFVANNLLEVKQILGWISPDFGESNYMFGKNLRNDKSVEWIRQWQIFVHWRRRNVSSPVLGFGEWMCPTIWFFHWNFDETHGTSKKSTHPTHQKSKSYWELCIENLGQIWLRFNPKTNLLSIGIPSLAFSYGTRSHKRLRRLRWCESSMNDSWTTWNVSNLDSCQLWKYPWEKKTPVDRPAIEVGFHLSWG